MFRSGMHGLNEELGIIISIGIIIIIETGKGKQNAYIYFAWCWSISRPCCGDVLQL